MSESNIYCVYHIHNLVNGKSYVGVSKELRRRINDHITGDRKGSEIVHRAVKKYGIDNFRIETLEEDLYRHKALEMEVWFVDFFDAYRNGYNLTPGGDMPPSLTPEARAKISAAHKGKKLSDETKKKISDSSTGKISWWWGKKHSEETKRKLSESKKGNTYKRGTKLSAESRQKMSDALKGKKRKPHSTESRQKMSDALKGRVFTDEWKRKISEAKKGQGKGRKHSAETKAKMSESHKRRRSVK